MNGQWEVPFLVAVIVVAILYISGRTRSAPDRSPPTPSSGPELIEQLQRTLNMAILVESVEPAEQDSSAEPNTLRAPGDPVTIRATFIFGRYTADGSVTGASEGEAWDALGRAAIAWRNADYQHIPLWGGGG
jgi:hypothetical protein